MQFTEPIKVMSPLYGVSSPPASTGFKSLTGNSDVKQTQK